MVLRRGLGVTGAAYLALALAADSEAAFAGADRLAREMHGFRAGWPVVRRLQDMGVPSDLIAVLSGAGDIGSARVSLSGDLWEPDGPDARLLVGVREQGVLVDAVAIASHEPDQWALRVGEGWCLGYDAWLTCEIGCAHALRLHGTPLAWLRAGGEGLCVLDWRAGLPLLRGLGERVLLRCDRGAGERLRAVLQYGNLPRVKEAGPSLITMVRAA